MPQTGQSHSHDEGRQGQSLRSGCPTDFQTLSYRQEKQAVSHFILKYDFVILLQTPSIPRESTIQKLVTFLIFLKGGGGYLHYIKNNVCIWPFLEFICVKVKYSNYSSTENFNSLKIQWSVLWCTSECNGLSKKKVYLN